MRQLSLFDEPLSPQERRRRAYPAHLPLPAYARLDIGRNLPLTPGELTALKHHGCIATATDEPGVYRVTGQIDGRDGEMEADDLRCDLDLFFLAAKARG